MAPQISPGARPGSGAAARRRRSRSEPVGYDFRRPIQLSREHQRILTLAFDNFARTATTVYTSTLRVICQVALVGIEQRAYAEYIESLGPQTYMTMFSADPMPGQGVIEMPVFAAMSTIDHMLGGPGSDDQPDRPLTEIESGVMKNFVERLLSEMRYSLSSLVPLEPAITGTEYSPQFAQIAGAADVMVVADFDLRIDERPHRMTICLPFSGLVPHLNNAANPSIVSERERLQKQRAAEMLEEQMANVPVTVAVQFRSTRLGPVDLSGLRPGDVIRLSHPAAAPLDVSVDETVFAHATAGARGRRLAALIVDTPKENDNGRA